MEHQAQVIIVGGGLAGLSAAVYLARAKRDLLLVDSGKSMARWEPQVENYLGFPAGISGGGLLERARRQARRYGARLKRDLIRSARRVRGRFILKGKKDSYSCEKLLLATGAFHIPPDLPGFSSCIGRSMFFCKDCDGFRVQGKRVAVYGWSNATVRYAVAMLTYASEVFVVTDGREPTWDGKHRAALREYNIPVLCQPITRVTRAGPRLKAMRFRGGEQRRIDALFTTRGDIVWNALGKELGAKLDAEGQIVTDVDMRTTVRGLYAAGCVTPANCQMIIAAGQGATAAQAINCDLFEESLNRRTRGRAGKSITSNRSSRGAGG
ncbi:MAG TPA: NAD(P)/FAD-dependent oxidoreductase [Verrucomicrobiae bacterium]|nr:NAD(P)/FAD-dependent oxidoreductase [Verrucomicrobiae bacterium]